MHSWRLRRQLEKATLESFDYKARVATLPQTSRIRTKLAACLSDHYQLSCLLCIHVCLHNYSVSKIKVHLNIYLIDFLNISTSMEGPLDNLQAGRSALRDS